MKRELSPKTYIFTFVALMLLFGLTAGLSWVDLGPFNLVVALGIAVAKALLIFLYFMHLRISRRLTWLFSGLGIVWLGILFTLSLSDFFTRGYLHIPGK